MQTKPWFRWVLENAQMGLIVLDQQGQLEYLNQWIAHHAGLTAANWQGKHLTDVFAGLHNSYFMTVVQRCLSTGFASFLSNSLHPSPLPLYQLPGKRGPNSLMKQSVHILPMKYEDRAAAGQRYVLIQVNDVTQAFNRERLLKAQAAALHGIARIDALTGIGNRRCFDETLTNEMRHAARARSVLSLILVDLDRFKRYNDTFGHVKGDETLTLTAFALRSVCLRSRDLAARYGGEELALILPDTDLAGAEKVATALQLKMYELNIAHPENPPSLRVTLSMGIASFTPPEALSTSELVTQADRALYHAKHSGRNRICYFQGTEPLEYAPPDTAAI